ncbi:MAG: elongation factor Ts [Candidatus Pacebacteria bacterium]|nr:elongation factor Ts [Candidatus Paceibacterota bacterium]
MMVNIKDIQKLREQTQAPIMECKKALEEAGDDFEKANQILKRKGELRAEKKEANDTKSGVVEAYIHSNHRLGALVELRCETDFVANNAEFKKLAYDLAMHIAALDPEYISYEKVPKEIIGAKEQEYKEELKSADKPPEIIDKIVKGKLEKEFQEICLDKQIFIKDETKNIGQLIKEAIAKFGEKIEISRFIRFQI